MGTIGGVLVAGTYGIVVSVGAGDHVLLKGLDINGLGPTPPGSLAGVAMLGGGTLTIQDCNIYGFQASSSGIGVSVAGAAGTHVLIESTSIHNNLFGISVQPQSGVTNSIDIERAVVDSNATANLNVATGATAVISQSSFTHSPNAIAYNGGGSVISYGNNVLRNAGLPTSTVPLQ